MKYNGWKDLAEAVVLTAVEDYAHILLRSHGDAGSRRDKRKLSEIRRFFRSDYFSILSDTSPEYIMRKIEEYASSLQSI